MSPDLQIPDPIKFSNYQQIRTSNLQNSQHKDNTTIIDYVIQFSVSKKSI